MPKWLLNDGNFTPWVQGVLTIGGAVIAFAGLKYDKSMWVAMLGLLTAAVGGISSRAQMLKIKPFDRSHGRARDSYKSKGDEDGRQ
ncbi:hypothetical protein [Burkholderia ambifaria]|jgi:hypothetical protein|uniref:hypothetical protein n=1 Tax=Burkholderia ambifaria TaxID=152480 RepID=UPI0011B278BC|nr:hypothetical protein [Burkholderia ambifaria]